MTITQSQLRPFGTTGLLVSPIGFGGAPIGLLETEEQDVGRVLSTLLDAGVNVIDTAAMYRGSEAMIGRTIGHRRDEYVLVSKCGLAIEESPAPAWSPELITASVDRSLQRLGVDHVDVMLLHSCELETLEEGAALQALIEAKAAGKARFIGYSGDNEAAAYAVQLPEIEVLQTSVNLCDQVNVDLALPAAQRNGVGVMAKRPLANAAWKQEEQQYEQYRNYGEPYRQRFAAMGLTPADLGVEEDVGWPEAAIRFTLSIPGVHTAIIGTTRPDHVAANLAAAAKGPLEARAVDTVRKAFAEATPAKGWEGLR